MWDMSGDPFENDLSKLFLKPSGEADPVRLKVQVLERLEQDDRRRRVVITGAAALGAAIAAVAVGASNFGDATIALIGDVVTNIPVLVLPDVSTVSATPWLAALFALALGGVLANRVIRDV